MTLPGLRAAVGRFADSFPGRCAVALVRLQVLDRAMALAAQAFTALIPLLLLIGRLAPTGHEDVVATGVIRRFRLDAGSAAAVRDVFSAGGGGSIGALSTVLLIISGVSFTRRLQRTYLDAWELPRIGGLRNSVDALLGLLALVGGVLLLAGARTLWAALPSGWVLGMPLTGVGTLALWTSVAWLLLDRRVPWSRMLPTGLLVAGCTAVYSAASAVYMDRLLASYSVRYGLFGVTLALVGWLLCVAFIVCGAAVVAAEFDRAPERWARRVRAAIRLPARPDGEPAPEVTGSGDAAAPRPSGSRAAC